MPDTAPCLPPTPQAAPSAHKSDIEVLASLAPTMKSEAALRTLIHLRALTVNTSHQTVEISTTKLAAQINQAQSAVRRALETLAARNLITVRKATATRPTIIQVNAFSTLFLPAVRVPLKGTPPANACSTKEHTPCLFEAHPVPLGGTPPAENRELSTAAATVDISSSTIQIFDRLSRAKTKDVDPDLLAKARHWLHGYACKLGSIPNPHPPADDMVARFLSIAEWPRLERLLYDLIAERKKPGENYPAWFIAVAIQRLHGIGPQQQKQARAALRLVKRGQPAAQQPAAPTQPDPGFAQDLLTQAVAGVGKLR